jgi:hypothetical protein
VKWFFLLLFCIFLPSSSPLLKIRYNIWAKDVTLYFISR